MNCGGPVFVIAIIAICTFGWVLNNWIRAKHGYPVENEWIGNDREARSGRAAPGRATDHRECRPEEPGRPAGGADRGAGADRHRSRDAHRPRNRKSALSDVKEERNAQKSDLAEQVIIPNLPWIIGGGMLLGPSRSWPGCSPPGCGSSMAIRSKPRGARRSSRA